MRKAVPILYLLALVGGLLAAPAASAATSTLVVVATVGSNIASVAGTPVALDQPPVLVNGRTLVPFRFFGQALGANVHWVAETKEVRAVFGLTTVELYVGKTTAFIKGQPATLDVPPCIIGGRVMVPLRFLASAFGWEVTWDAALRAATVKRASIESVRQIAVGGSEWAFLPAWGDTHWFEFEAKAGTVYAINSCGEGLPEIVVCDTDGNVVAEKSNPQVGQPGGLQYWLGSPIILFAPDADATCRVKVVQEQLGPEYGGQGPSSVLYGVQVAIPTPVTLGTSYPLEAYTEQFEKCWYVLQATAGKTYEVAGDYNALYVVGPDLRWVEDDHGLLTATVSGPYYLAVEPDQEFGSYAITVTQVQ